MTGLLHPSDEQYDPPAHLARHAFLEAPRPSPLDWVRQRRADREQRRVEAAHQKAAQRMETLGQDWRVLDLQERAGRPMTFLAFGPSGVFAVTVKDHGRSRVSFAGDVVQIDGRRPPYVEEARDNAAHAARVLSRAAGVAIPVLPVLAFAGNGVITVYGMPKGCIVTSYRELSRVLDARGRRLASGTVEKLFALAAHPTTWVNPRYVALADRYRWYADDDAAAG